MHYFLTALTVLLLTGCISQPKVANSSQKPSWIINPTKDGKIGAIGVAGRTYDQKVSTQRKIAITRALDELSLQQSVKVNLKMKKSDVVINNRSQTSLDTKSNYDASSTISAHIESVYKDRYTGELYVWMVLD